VPAGGGGGSWLYFAPALETSVPATDENQSVEIDIFGETEQARILVRRFSAMRVATEERKSSLQIFSEGGVRGYHLYLFIIGEVALYVLGRCRLPGLG
jgi:hypothetical protein